jgi:hypothetical protein
VTEAAVPGSSTRSSATEITNSAPRRVLGPIGRSGDELRGKPRMGEEAAARLAGDEGEAVPPVRRLPVTTHRSR